MLDYMGLLARLDRFQHYLLLGQQRQVLAALAELPDDDAVAIWLRMRLRQALPEAVVAALPSDVAEQWRGWRAYYEGDYLHAARHFIQAWDTPVVFDVAGKADIALGLGKAYTRIGHWQAARAWLLQSLALGRQQNRLFDIVQGYGALGELLLRADHPQAAFTCLSCAYHALPPGSGQRPRQLNYLASALLRCGAFLRAESLLLTSVHLAHDSGDGDSVWHALARLQFLRIDDGCRHDLDVESALSEYLPREQSSPVASGFLALGQAMSAVRRDDRAAALIKAREAQLRFASGFPIERWWASQWEGFLSDKGVAIDAACLALLQSPAVFPPAFTVVADASWQRLPLPDDNGFLPLAQEPHNIESLWAARRLFFI